MPHISFDTRPRVVYNPKTRQQKLVAAIASNRLHVRGLLDSTEVRADEVVFKIPNSVASPYGYIAILKSPVSKPLIKYLFQPPKKHNHLFYQKYQAKWLQIWEWLEYRRNEIRPTSYR